jgi:hypothetical protein
MGIDIVIYAEVYDGAVWKAKPAYFEKINSGVFEIGPLLEPRSVYFEKDRGPGSTIHCEVRLPFPTTMGVKQGTFKYPGLRPKISPTQKRLVAYSCSTFYLC